MNDHDLQRILRLASNQTAERETAAETPRPGFADSVLARLPVVRFVIPGSNPGARVMAVAGMVGLVTAAAVAWTANSASASSRNTPAGTGTPPPVESSFPFTPPPVNVSAAVAEGSPGQPQLRLFQPREPEYRPPAPVP